MPERTEPLKETWMSDRELDFRNKTEGYLRTASGLGLFPGHELHSYQILLPSASSVVYKVTTEAGNCVAKLHSDDPRLGSEARSLRLWENSGIPVPRVLDFHSPDEKLPVSILVLDYIDSPILEKVRDVQARITSGDSRAMGRILSRMHKISGTGFGFLKEGPDLAGKYPGFAQAARELKDYTVMNLQTIEGLVLAEDLKLADRAAGILEKKCSGDFKPVLTHNDFSPSNIFYTPGLVIFDPIPMLSHPAMDLSASLLFARVNSREYGEDEAAEILAGYEESGAIDREALAAATVLTALTKMVIWAKKGRKVKLDLTRRILSASEKEL